jgi:predicted DNA-binding protein with PD1-like motif
MVARTAHARITDIIVAQLDPDGDIYNEIMTIAKDHQIETGFVINIVGGLRKARLSMPLSKGDVEAQPGVLELEGLMECSGVGTLGMNRDTYDSEGSSGILYKEGEPNIHVHMTVTHEGKTYMGHLIEGCQVRSLHESSHFSIMIAKTEGAMLNFRVSKERTDAYPRGIPIHDLVSA